MRHSLDKAEGAVKLWLTADEQVTLTTPAGGEYDIACKDWGLYATPSFRRRLARFKLRPALVERDGDRFLMLVEAGSEQDFFADLTAESFCLVTWLDEPALDTECLTRISDAATGQMRRTCAE